MFLQIEAIELPIDPKLNKRRGFVFITFKEEDPVKKVLEKKFHTVSGSKVRYQNSASLAFGSWRCRLGWATYKPLLG